jgi:hypothetical protein
MKFVRPLYRALLASTVGKKEALATFAKHKNMYAATLILSRFVLFNISSDHVMFFTE